MSTSSSERGRLRLGVVCAMSEGTRDGRRTRRRLGADSVAGLMDDSQLAMESAYIGAQDAASGMDRLHLQGVREARALASAVERGCSPLASGESRLSSTSVHTRD